MPRTWVNGGTPALSAANLNDLETELALALSRSVKTAVINYPPLLELATGTVNTHQWRGTFFICTQSGTVTQIRNRINAISGQTYTFGIYELSPTDRVTVAAVTGTVTVVAGSSTDQVLTQTASIPIVAGKCYALMTGSPGNTYNSFYYNGTAHSYDSAVTTTIYAGGASPGRNFSSGAISVGSVLGGGSDSYCHGMTVTY